MLGGNIPPAETTVHGRDQVLIDLVREQFPTRKYGRKRERERVGEGKEIQAVVLFEQKNEFVRNPLLAKKPAGMNLVTHSVLQLVL